MKSAKRKMNTLRRVIPPKARGGEATKEVC